mgnify:CR=1 FL=1
MLTTVCCISWIDQALRCDQTVDCHNKDEEMEMAGGVKVKKVAAWIALAALAVGIIIHLVLPAD